MNRYQWISLGCAASALVCGAIAMGNYVPVSYGAAEGTTATTGLTFGGGAISLASIGGLIWSVIKSGRALIAVNDPSNAVAKVIDLLKSIGLPTDVLRKVTDALGPILGDTKSAEVLLTDATKLLPLIVKQDSGLENSVVRTLVVALEVHCARKKPSLLPKVHEIAIALMTPDPAPPAEHPA